MLATMDITFSCHLQSFFIAENYTLIDNGVFYLKKYITDKYRTTRSQMHLNKALCLKRSFKKTNVKTLKTRYIENAISKCFP